MSWSKSNAALVLDSSACFLRSVTPKAVYQLRNKSRPSIATQRDIIGSNRALSKHCPSTRHTSPYFSLRIVNSWKVPYDRVSSRVYEEGETEEATTTASAAKESVQVQVEDARKSSNPRVSSSSDMDTDNKGFVEEAAGKMLHIDVNKPDEKEVAAVALHSPASVKSDEGPQGMDLALSAGLLSPHSEYASGSRAGSNAAAGPELVVFSGGTVSTYTTTCKTFVLRLTYTLRLPGFQRRSKGPCATNNARYSCATSLR